MESWAGKFSLNLAAGLHTTVHVAQLLQLDTTPIGLNRSIA